MVACIDLMDPLQWLQFVLSVGCIAMFIGAGAAVVFINKSGGVS